MTVFTRWGEGLARRIGRPPLRDHLALTLGAALLPTIVLTGHLLLEDARDQSERMKAHMEQMAEALAQSVDRDVLASVEALTMLARSPALLDGQRRTSVDKLEDVKSLRASWEGVFLLDRSGGVIHETVVAGGGSARGCQPPAAILSVDRDWVVGPVGTDATCVRVVVPVRVRGDVAAFVGARVDLHSLQQLLQTAAAVPGRTIALLDGDGRVLARAPEDAALPPRDARDEPSLRSRSIAGVTEVRRRGQEAQYVAWRSLAMSNWSVEVSTPARLVDEAFYKALYRALLLGGTSLLVGLVLAVPLARRIIGPLRTLAREGPAGLPGGSAIQEIQQLSDALAQAAGQTQRTQQRLQDAADEFRVLFEASPIGLAFAEDTDCRVVRTNEAFDRITEEVSGSLPARVYLDGVRVERTGLPLCRAAGSGAELRDVELEVESVDGTRKVVLMSALPLRDKQGALRGAVGAAVDITNRKRIEAELLQADVRVRQTQRLIDLAQESASVGFFQYVPATDRAIWSVGHAKLFGGAPPGEVEGAYARWMAPVHAEDRPMVERAMQTTLSGEQPKLQVDYRIVVDGAERWVTTRIATSYDESGRPVEMVGVTMDVTDQKRAELTRARLAEQEQAARVVAEAANRAKDQFLAMLGHELRNPLGALTTAVAVVQRVDRSNPASAEAIAIIARQTGQLGRLIDDLLDVARVVSGKIALQTAPLDLAELVRRNASVGMAQAGGRHRIVLVLAPAWIDGDPVRLDQIVNNLLSNALKHTAPGKTVTIVTRTDGQEARLEVIDEGPGIAPELLESMFEPFVQGDRSIDRRMGGLGIGLTLVRHLVQMHEGVVKATSSPDGTRMSVQFAAVRPGPAADRVSALSAALPVNRRTVLLVEDNGDARAALRTILELEGHAVRVAASGTEGLAMLLAEPPDVAIVDIGLPELSGIDVTRQARAGGFQGLLIALSGYGQKEDRATTHAAGFDAHLVKPVAMGVLMELVGGGMQNRRNSVDR